MGFFDNLVKKADNEFAFKVIDNLDEKIEFIDTGSYALNALLCGSIWGGLPNNKMILFAGEPSSGKSFFCISIGKQFLDANPEGAIMYFESEGALDDTVDTKEMLEARGVDSSRCHIFPVETIQEFRSQALRILTEYLATPEEDRKPMIMILDSLTGMSTDKEVEDMTSGADIRDMTGQQKNKGAFRALTLKMNKAKVPLIVTTHVYDQIGVMYPTKIAAGGRGVQYAASIIAFLSKAKAKDADSDLIGAYITFNLQKSRFTKEGSKVTLLLNHTTGLDKYYGLVDIALAGDVFKKDGRYILLPQGERVFESAIIKNPEKYLTEEYLNAIDVATGKMFKYGVQEDDTDAS